MSKIFTRNNLSLLLIILIIGTLLYLIYRRFTRKHMTQKVQEGFENQECPDILVQKGKHIFLHRSKAPEVPGINPIKFNNLEDYVEYFEWQRSQGKKCPILYLQNSFDAQGNLVYINRPSPIEKEGGLPLISGLDLYNMHRKTLLFDSTRNHMPFNKNLYPGFDPDDQNIGLKTPLDKMYHQNPGGVSPSAMDPNWGGSSYTENRVLAGDYKDDEVKIYVP